MQDPQFSSDLGAKIKSNTAPVPPPPKAVLKGRAKDPTKTALFRSLFLHGIIFAIFLLYPVIDSWFGWNSERTARLKAIEATRTAIRVDVVDLPRLKLSEAQKVDLSQEVNKDLKDAKAEKTPEVSPTVMVDKTKKEPEAKKTAKDENPEKLAEKKSDRLKELQDALRADQKRREVMARLQKKDGTSTNGRQEIAGNIKSEGYSTTGEVANSGDVYNGKAKAHLQQNWHVPGWLSAGSLKARIVVKIAPSGKVIFKEFTSKSANVDFNESILKAVDRADPFPPPPEALRRTYMEEGVEFGFPQ